MTTATKPRTFTAEVKPTADWVKLSPGRHQIRLRLDVTLSGRVWQTFGATTGAYGYPDKAKAEAYGLLASNPAWMTDEIDAELREQIKALA